GPARQRDRGLLHRSGGRPPFARRRLGHSQWLRPLGHGPARTSGLRGEQSGGSFARAHAGVRAGAATDPRQHRRAGSDAYAHLGSLCAERRSDEGAGGALVTHDPARSDGRGRGDRAGRALFGVGRRRDDHGRRNRRRRRRDGSAVRCVDSSLSALGLRAAIAIMLAAMRFRIGPFAALLLVVGCRTSPPAAAPGPRFEVSLASGIAPAPLDGRLILIVSRNATTEPRLQVSGNDETAQIFGIDVHGFGDQRRITVGGDAVGYPLRSLAELPAGDYQVQAVLHRYETFHRADGHTVQLPMDRGEGQHWNLQPGNPMSRPTRVHLDGAAAAAPIALVLDHVLPALPPTPDTRWLKHVRIKSELLSRFWGRDIELGALVLVPEGWDSHPQAHYPVVIEHSHFERELAGWRETPPDPKLPPADLEALKRDCPDGHYNHCAEHGYERVVQEAGYRFYKQWTGAGFPRVLLVAIQHANPYYDDSYAVNSANLGPWGDAITHELIPAIEKQFRGLGPWARGMYGGSTGGWETLADQIFYPDDYNGAIANCPDPIDFRAYVTTDLYRDVNAFYSEGAQRRTPRVASRDGF